MLKLVLYLVLAQQDENLIRELGNDDYGTREAAQKQLSHRMTFTLYRTMGERKEHDAEIRRRMQSLRDSFRSNLKEGWKIKLQCQGVWPQIDMGMPHAYALGGRWQGWCKYDFTNVYCAMADELGAPCEGSPKWTRYRMATELWIGERVQEAFDLSLSESDTEMGFRFRMARRMHKIQQDVDMLIKGDRDYLRCERLQ